MNQIVNGLYLGSYKDAHNYELLVRSGITHIVNLSRLPDFYPDSFSYLHIDIEDDEEADINRYFTRTSRFIHNAILNGGIVLVHCMAGISRSPTIVIAYLVQKRKLSLNQAMLTVKSMRPQIDPNEGFIEQLRERFIR